MKFYSTATLNIATGVHVQHIQIRKGGFVKPDNNLLPNSIRMKTTKYFMSSFCRHERQVINYLTAKDIEILLFLSRRLQRILKITRNPHI